MIGFLVTATGDGQKAKADEFFLAIGYFYEFSRMLGGFYVAFNKAQEQYCSLLKNNGFS